MRVAPEPLQLLFIAALMSSTACRNPTYDARREQTEAQAFVNHLNDLSRTGRWAEFSTLLDPDPHCTHQGCITRALATGSACATPVKGRVEFRANAIELFQSGDGFSVAATLSGAEPPCQFIVDINRADGAGPYYVPVVRADL